MHQDSDNDSYTIRPPWIPMLIIAACGALVLWLAVMVAVGVDFGGEKAPAVAGWRKGE